MTPLRAFATWLLVLLACAACAWGVAARCAGGAAPTTLLGPDNVEEALAATFASYPTPEENAWTVARMAAHAEPLLVGARDGLSLQGLLAARVSAAELPDEAHAPLTRLRERLAKAATQGRSEVLVVRPSTLVSYGRKLGDAGYAVRTPEAFLAAFGGALGRWALGWAILGVVSAATLRPARSRAWLRVMGATTVLTAAGLTLQAIHAGPVTGASPGPFADHVLFATLAASALLLGARALRGRLAGAPAWVANGGLAFLAALALLAVLAGFGTGPNGSLARINVATPFGSFQPLEWAKLLIAVAIARLVGRYRHHLRVPARWLGPVPVPSPRLLLPVGITMALGLSMGFAFHDYGTVLVLALGLGLVLVTATGRAEVAGAMVAGAGASLLLLARYPWEAGTKEAQRFAMWADLWYAGVDGSDQVPAGIWAMATGGLLGVGAPAASGRDIPAAATDLVLPLLVESWGFVGFVLVLAAYAVLIHTLLGISAAHRGPDGEHQLAASAIGLVLAAQVTVIGLGIVGALPLAGVVTPFLSLGGTAMTMWIVALAFVAADQGEAAVAAPAGDPLLRGLVLASGGYALLFALVTGRVGWFSVVKADEMAAHPTLARQAEDDEVVAVHNPRLVRLLDEVPRQRILDPEGRPFAEPAPEGGRAYPAGEAGVSLVGVASNGLLPYAGTFERTRMDAFGMFPATTLVVQPYGAPQPISLVTRDLSSLVAASRAGKTERRALLDALAAGFPDLRTSVNRDVQVGFHALLAEAAAASGAEAAMGVIIDAATGEVIAQASAPSIDPASVTRAMVDLPRYNGEYGLLTDRAGRTAEAPGSTFKALVDAAARSYGLPDLFHTCTGSRVVPGPNGGTVTDGRRGPHHEVDADRGLTLSCNIWASYRSEQVGSARLRAFLAPLAFTHLHLPDAGGIDLAATGFGQGETLATPREMAVAYAALANGGSTRVCELLAPVGTPLACTDLTLTTPEAVAPVVASLRHVVTAPEGTGHRAREPVGASYRVYLKTGTAEKGENGRATPRTHAWATGFLEGIGGGEHRYAFAILVARGGGGGAVAAPLVPGLAALLIDAGYLPATPGRVSGTH